MLFCRAESRVWLAVRKTEARSEQNESRRIFQSILTENLRALFPPPIRDKTYLHFSDVHGVYSMLLDPVLFCLTRHVFGRLFSCLCSCLFWMFAPYRVLIESPEAQILYCRACCKYVCVFRLKAYKHTNSHTHIKTFFADLVSP